MKKAAEQQLERLSSSLGEAGIAMAVAMELIEQINFKKEKAQVDFAVEEIEKAKSSLKSACRTLARPVEMQFGLIWYG